MNAEIKVRRGETEREVRAGRMKVSERDYIIESLEAIGDTLRKLATREQARDQRQFGDDAPAPGERR